MWSAIPRSCCARGGRQGSQALRREMRKNEKKMREQEEALSLANAPEATGETPTAGMTEEAYEEKLHYIIHIQCSVATLHLH